MAKKEHQEFAHNIDFIDCLPPGLYEAIIVEKSLEAANLDFVNADHISRFEARTPDDIRALGCNTLEDERCFAAVDKFSQINLGFYRTLLQPVVRVLANEQMAENMRRMHHLRFSYETFSDNNPLLMPLESLAKSVLENRQPVKPDNIFWQWQKVYSDCMDENLDLFRQWTENLSEQMFFGIYQNPFFQAALGLRASDDPPRPKPGQNQLHQEFVKKRIEELRKNMDKGGTREAVIRSIIYVRLEENAPDERAFGMPFPGRVQVIDSTFDEYFVSIALKPKSPFRKPINEALLKFLKTPHWNEIRNRYIP